MPDENYFDQNPVGDDQIKGDKLVNLRKEKYARITDQDGNTQDYLIEIHDSRPDGNGSYTDTELINVITDHAGNPLPKDPRDTKRSCTGLNISLSDEIAYCTSMFHRAPNNRILLGQDGHKTGDGAICSRCQSAMTTVYMLITILGIGLLIGFFKGTGIF